MVLKLGRAWLLLVLGLGAELRSEMWGPEFWCGGGSSPLDRVEETSMMLDLRFKYQGGDLVPSENGSFDVRRDGC